jgi:hypothetical protein
VGGHPALNTWRNDDGASHDRLETGPLNRIDTAGAEALRRVADFAIASGADEHMRVLDWPAEERVSLYVAIAGMMVRSEKLRGQLDDHALPSLLEEMRGRLAAAERGRTADREVIGALRATLDRPGAVALDLARNRHQAALVPLIKTVATTLRDHLAAVRQLPEPALHTGSEPVVVFPTHRLDEGRSCAELLTETQRLVRIWDEPKGMLDAVERSFAQIAGLVLAIDPRTVLILFNPDTEEGCMLLFAASHISPAGLAGIVNMHVTANSDWIAGRDDCEFLQMSIQAIQRIN